MRRLEEEQEMQTSKIFTALARILRMGISAMPATAAIALAICCSAALAQSGAGSIQGTVTDASGAAIPGASIRVVNQATGVAVNTKTNGVGFYQVPELFTGTYSVSISAPNMKTNVQTIELLVAQNAVINATLTTGAVSQQVTVAGNAVQLTDTTNGTVGTTLESQRINQLPMNGRDILALTNETTPGLESNCQSTSCVNSLMPGAMAYEVDGVQLNNQEFGGVNQYGMPDPDSVQEVTVETTGVGAMYTPPAVGILTTKSGTNHLHGTFFETARNNAWGIAKQRQDLANFAAPHYVRNEFGASIGGPIVIPHLYHGKDRTFFFFAYERYSLANKSSLAVSTPTAAMRAGDWSGLVNSSGVLQQLYDPATTAANAACPVPTGGTTNNPWCRTPFPTSASGAPNQIPINRLSPTDQIFYAMTPLPTNSANPLVQANLDIANPSYTAIPQVNFRIDHAFNENNHAYLRYTEELDTSLGIRNFSGNQKISLATTVNGVSFPAGATGISSSPDGQYAATLGYTHTFSPTFFAETLLNQQNFFIGDLAGGSPNTDFEKELGMPNNFGESGFPQIESSLNSMSGTMYQYSWTQVADEVDENLTKVLGKHQFQFGGRVWHERVGYRENQYADGANYGAYATALLNPSTIGSNQYSAYTNTGYADADEFLGGADQYNVYHEPPYIHFHSNEVDAYFQDNYRVTRNLTLNLGLRYEAIPAPWMKYGTITGFDLKNDALVVGGSISSLIAEGYTTQAIITNMKNDGAKIETPQEADLPSVLTNSYDLNFLPRFGFAWQPFGKWGTVLRGGYGLYTYPIPQYFYMKVVGQQAPFLAEYSEIYAGTGSAAYAPDDLPNYLMRTSLSTASSPPLGQPGITGLNTANAVNSNSTTAIPPGITADSVDPDDAPDMVTQANVTLEQPLKGNSALRVSWLYSHDANLWEGYYFNTHPSAYVWEMQHGITTPNGNVPGSNQYAATATGPYDQTTWASGSERVQKTGWSTDNQLQVAYQRLYHRGIAWEIAYNWSKPMHTSGESGSDGNVNPSADYLFSALSTMTSPYGTAISPALPQPQPAGTAPYAYYKNLARFEYYRIDTDTPLQHVKFNGIVDLPFGRGERFLGGAKGFQNELVGGWQLAGDGDIHSQDFLPVSSMWGPTSQVHVYKHKVPITDCRSGVCYKEHEWFNGYLAPTVTQGLSNSDCTKNCVSGLPTNWVPYQTPVDTTPGSTYYGENEVNITLLNGKTSAIPYSPGGAGSNPFSKTTLPGPFNWTADASLFKVFPIKERMNLRFNLDAFNVFNVQGEQNPNTTDGSDCTTPGGVGCSSYNQARQLQFTLRLTF